MLLLRSIAAFAFVLPTRGHGDVPDADVTLHVAAPDVFTVAAFADGHRVVKVAATTAHGAAAGPGIRVLQRTRPGKLEKKLAYDVNDFEFIAKQGVLAACKQREYR